MKEHIETLAMGNENEMLASQLSEHFGAMISSPVVALDEVTIEMSSNDMLQVFQLLRDEAVFNFDQLIDICGVDYSAYGCSEWETSSATSEGFSRGVDRSKSGIPEFESSTWSKARFAVVYHLLSVADNKRLRVRVFADDAIPQVESVTSIWSCADWFEREAFDLYGILFAGHPDLRRLLTDYGFIGHPFRKDFPLLGNVEMRYDDDKKRVVYEPLQTELRVLVPRVIRDEHTNETAEEK